jgi:hypothetical protein
MKVEYLEPKSQEYYWYRPQWQENFDKADEQRKRIVILLVLRLWISQTRVSPFH